MWSNFEPKLHLYWVNNHFERNASSFKFDANDLTNEEHNFAQHLIGRISCKAILDNVNDEEMNRRIGNLRVVMCRLFMMKDLS